MSYALIDFRMAETRSVEIRVVGVGKTGANVLMRLIVESRSRFWGSNTNLEGWGHIPEYPRLATNHLLRTSGFRWQEGMNLGRPVEFHA